MFVAAWVCADTYKSTIKFALNQLKDDERVNKSKAFKKVEEYLNKIDQGEK